MIEYRARASQCSPCTKLKPHISAQIQLELLGGGARQVAPPNIGAAPPRGTTTRPDLQVSLLAAAPAEHARAKAELAAPAIARMGSTVSPASRTRHSILDRYRPSVTRMWRPRVWSMRSVSDGFPARGSALPTSGTNGSAGLQAHGASQLTFLQTDGATRFAGPWSHQREAMIKFRQGHGATARRFSAA
jgi:hypothetical protein